MDNNDIEEPKVVWLDSWKEQYGFEPTESAHYNRKTNIIYAIKGRAKINTIEHERSHAIQYLTSREHYDKENTPEEYVLHELEAEKYAYQKTGKPKRLYDILIALHTDLFYNVYKLNVIDATNLLEKTLKQIDPPYRWLDDFARVKKRLIRNVGEKRWELAEQKVKEHPRKYRMKGMPNPDKLRGFWVSSKTREVKDALKEMNIDPKVLKRIGMPKIFVAKNVGYPNLMTTEDTKTHKREKYQIIIPITSLEKKEEEDYELGDEGKDDFKSMMRMYLSYIKDIQEQEYKRPKKHKNMKDWWDDRYYQEMPIQRKLKTQTHYSSKILPPQLDTQL